MSVEVSWGDNDTGWINRMGGGRGVSPISFEKDGMVPVWSSEDLREHPEGILLGDLAGVSPAKHSTDTSCASARAASLSMLKSEGFDSARTLPVAAQTVLNFPPSEAGTHFPPMRSPYSCLSCMMSSVMLSACGITLFVFNRVTC